MRGCQIVLGFYYSRYPEPDPNTPEDQQQPYYNKVYLHKVGTPQSEDELIYERPDEKGIQLCADGLR